MIPYRPVSAPKGLPNPGALCYFNSLLQALRACPASGFTYNVTAHAFGLPNTQQDAHEAFVRIMDNKPYARHFHVRYICDIFCLSCHKLITHKDEATCPPELYIDVEGDVTIDKLRWHTVRVQYDCPCGGKEAIKGYRLTRVSSVLIILFKKYHGKVLQDFPLQLEFPAKNANLQYKLVAQIEHFGTMSGGHYTARVLGPSGVVNCNDSSLRPSRFEPTPETYMLFYHFEREVPKGRGENSY